MSPLEELAKPSGMDEWAKGTIERLRLHLQKMSTEEIMEYQLRRAGTIPEIMTLAIGIEIASRSKKQLPRNEISA